MSIEQILTHDIEESQRALNRPNDDTIYRRDKQKHSIIEQDPLDSELRILDWIIPFSSSFLIFSRFDGRTHEGLR